MKVGGAPRPLFHQDFNELRQAGHLRLNVPEGLGGMGLKNPWTPKTMHRSPLANHTQILLHRIRDTIHGIEPAARIILYGSRARGDARPDSDWDLLILLNGAVDHHRAATVRHRLYDLELENDRR